MREQVVTENGGDPALTAAAWRCGANGLGESKASSLPLARLLAEAGAVLGGTMESS